MSSTVLALPTAVNSDLATLSDAELKGVTFSLERTRCFGNCPAYSVTIQGDGGVEYVGNRNVKETGGKRGHIDLPGIRSLLAEFANAKFLSISKSYSEEKCTACSLH